MMTDDEAKRALDLIEAKREIINAVLASTRLKLETLVEELKDETPTPENTKRLASLTLQARVWIHMLDRLAAEAADVATRLGDQTKNKKTAAPVIDMNEIDVPDFMPEEL